jgi:septum formation protein
MKIVLASASPRRKELLESLGLKFEVASSNVDEEFDSKLSIIENVEQLALKKALSVAEKLAGNFLVIGSDTIVVLDNQVLGKPSDEEEAKKMLRLLSGSEHEVITSIALVNTENKSQIVSHSITKVFFRELSESEIVNYVKTGEPMDKAGAYGIQGLGVVLAEKIEGCFTNVVGLSLPLLAKMLKENYNINII